MSKTISTCLVKIHKEPNQKVSKTLANISNMSCQDLPIPCLFDPTEKLICSANCEQLFKNPPNISHQDPPTFGLFEIQTSMSIKIKSPNGLILIHCLANASTTTS